MTKKQKKKMMKKKCQPRKIVLDNILAEDYDK